MNPIQPMTGLADAASKVQTFLKGHDFSRAARRLIATRALAPEGRFSNFSPVIRTFSAACAAGLLAAVLGSLTAAAQPTRADAEKDPILKAMLQELDRSKTQLQLKGFEKPFYIQYRIEDVETYQTKAEFGASEGSGRSHQRVLEVHLLDFNRDIYGQELEVIFVSKLRDEQKFASVDELKKQIAVDISRARQLTGS